MRRQWSDAMDEAFIRALPGTLTGVKLAREPLAEAVRRLGGNVSFRYCSMACAGAMVSGLAYGDARGRKRMDMLGTDLGFG